MPVHARIPTVRRDRRSPEGKPRHSKKKGPFHTKVPLKNHPFCGSTYGVVWRGATARGAIERVPDNLRDMTAVGSMTVKCLPG